MPHRMLRSAATVLLASAPVFAAAPAQAAAQQGFPCEADIQKVDKRLTSKVTLSIECPKEQTVSAKVTVGGNESTMRQTVPAGVRQDFSFTVNKVPQVCAELEADRETAKICAS